MSESMDTETIMSLLKEKAKELYESGAYQAVVGKRLDATSGHFAVLIDGIA